MSTELAQSVIKYHDSLKADAGNWLTTWEEAAKYILPRKGGIIGGRSEGSTQTSNLFDSTAEESCLIYAAGMVSQIMPPGEAWARFEPADKDAPAAFKEWLEKATDTTFRYLYASNFYLAAHEAFLDGGCFGTRALYVEEGTKKPLNFVSLQVGSFFGEENADGMVDTVSREFLFTARQAEQKWGREALGKMMQDILSQEDKGQQNRKFTIIHQIKPRAQYDEGMTIDAKRRPIASIYVCKEDSHVLEEGGFYEMPVAVGRELRSNQEVYGRGPGVQCLPEIRMLNDMERDILLAVEREVNPGWIQAYELPFQPDNRPGGVTFFEATHPELKPEQQQYTNRIDLGEVKTDQKRRRIRAAFHVDMFQMLSNAAEAKREKTAFEVAQMVQEKLILFSPVFARYTQEMLNPILERVFFILLRAGAFGEMPQVAVNPRFEIVYVSKIALAIKAAQANSLMQVAQLVEAISPFDEGVALVVKWAKATRDVARDMGLRADWLPSDEELENGIAQMQQAKVAMQQAQTAEMAAGAVRNLGPGAQEKATSAIS